MPGGEWVPLVARNARDAAMMYAADVRGDNPHGETHVDVATAEGDQWRFRVEWTTRVEYTTSFCFTVTDQCAAPAAVDVDTTR